MNKPILPPKDDLLAEVRAFCERTGVAKTTFGKVAVNDTSFVANLEEGRECRRATLRRVREYMLSEDLKLQRDAAESKPRDVGRESE